MGAAQRVRSSFARCTPCLRRVSGSAHELALKLTFSLFCPRPCSAAYTYTSIADCHTRSANALWPRGTAALSGKAAHRCVPSAQAVKRLGARVRRRQGLHAPAPTSAAPGRGLHHAGVRGGCGYDREGSARQILHGHCSRSTSGILCIGQAGGAVEAGARFTCRNCCSWCCSSPR